MAMSKGKSNGSGDASMVAALPVVIKGAAKVKSDAKSGRVMGSEVDPWKPRDRAADKTKRKVELPKSKPEPDKKKPNESTRVELGKTRKTSRAIKGVESVDTYPKRNLVTVRGSKDGKALPATVEAKLKLEINVGEPKEKKKDAIIHYEEEYTRRTSSTYKNGNTRRVEVEHHRRRMTINN